ncbi:MAG: 16S rRNA (cytosine(1402)-N(4))-methyltransferase [Clostridiales bacterium]|nr:MAG: 16S rRNA (cytosine(1402)-N(4))-methyltransferase [Clostridiales bacterium]
MRKYFFEYGEEKNFSRRIASQIVKTRGEKPIETTLELSELVKKMYSAKDG